MSLLTLLSRPSYAFATSPLALDFKAVTYKESGTGFALTALPGYSYARTGQVSFVNASGTVTDFAANVQPVLSTIGWENYGALTNLETNSQAFGSRTLAGLTVTSDNVIAPDGTT